MILLTNSRNPAFIIACIAVISGFLFGYDTGIISGAQVFIFQHFGIGDTAATAAIRGFVVASVPVGGLLGAIISGWTSTQFGRKNSIIITSVLFICGALITALANTIELIVAGRLIIGAAIGISCMIVPMYLSEIALPQKRGALVFMFQLSTAIGLIAAFLINFACQLWIEDANIKWRCAFALGSIPAVILFLGMLPIPDSPQWLLMHNQMAKATATLKLLYKKNDVQFEIHEIQQSVHRVNGSWHDIIRAPISILLIMSFALVIFQQLSGINAIMYYGPIILRKAGFGENAKFIAQIAMGVVNMLMSILGLWIIDRSGRRPILLWGLSGILVFLLAIGCLLKASSLTPAVTYLSFASILGYIAFFAVSLGAIPGIIMSEIFPLKARASGMAIASCVGWAFNIVITQSFTIFESGLGIGNTLLMYAICTAAGLVLVWRFIPETKNRSLEDIEANLYEGKALRNLGDSR